VGESCTGIDAKRKQSQWKRLSLWLLY